MTGTRYRILVRGRIDAATLERLGEPEARVSAEHTQLVCDVVDQSQLVGVLSGLSGAGIEVLSATPVDS